MPKRTTSIAKTSIASLLQDRTQRVKNGFTHKSVAEPKSRDKTSKTSLFQSNGLVSVKHVSTVQAYRSQNVLARHAG